MSEDLRRRILRSAKAEFARKGLSGASTRAIAGRAGATAAMINYYFGSKKALYDSVVAEAMGRLQVRLRAALAQGSDRSLAARLAAAYFDFLVEERELQRIMMREMLEGGGEPARFARRHLRPIKGLLALAAPGVRAGELAHASISLYGAVAGYFLYAPMLSSLLDEPPLSRAALAQRRRHVLDLAERIDPTRRDQGT